MAEIHPTFDPSAGKWFEGRHSAPTIRELLKKLPPGTKVRDYYPDGREVMAAERGFVIHDMRRAAEIRPKLDHAPRACVIRPTRKNIEAAPTIQVAAEAPTDRVVAEVRPKRRVFNGFRRRGAYDKNKVFEMHMSGYSSREITAALGAEAKLDTVASMIQVGRQRGDPRAWIAADPRRAANRLARLAGGGAP